MPEELKAELRVLAKGENRSVGNYVETQMKRIIAAEKASPTIKRPAVVHLKKASSEAAAQRTVKRA